MPDPACVYESIDLQEVSFLRAPTPPRAEVERIVAKAEAPGCDTSQLSYVKH